MKGIGLIALGLAIGSVAAILFQQNFGTEQERLVPVSDRSAEEIDEFREQIDRQIAAIDERLLLLGSAVDELSEQLASAGAQPEETPTETPTIDRSDPSLWRGRPAAQQFRAPQISAEQDDPERLSRAGFTQDRIDWLDRRVEELQMEARQAQSEPASPEGQSEGDALQAMMTVVEPHSLLRPEVGDDEYERYLQAKGLRTTVDISRVLASSPAEQGGLRVGDEIVAYGGERVFSFLGLRSIAAKRSPDESVLVEIRRDGYSTQLTIRGGDLGIDSCVVNCRVD